MTAPADFYLTSAADLLPEACALGLAWSRQLCRYVDHSGHDCAAYHGLWPYLLRFGLATGTPRHAEFYRDAIRGGGNRVLASGAADYHLPATMMWAYAESGATPDLTVVDICETPLRLCQWFGERVGAPIETVTSDILSFQPERRYDFVAVHSFMGLFPPANWGRLVASWYDSLVPGGRVAMVHRLRPDAPELIRFTADQAKDFRARFLRQALRHAAELPVTPEELAALTDGYTAHSVIYPLRSCDELTALFEGNGFKIDSLAVDPIDPTMPATSPGPTLLGGAEYVRLIAVKP
jgi:SAM-dependent methyltransferase